MIELTPVLQYGAFGLLFLVLGGIGLGLREFYKLQHARESNRMSLAHEREVKRDEARAESEQIEAARRQEDTVWLRDFVARTQEQQAESLKAFQELSDRMIAAQQDVAKAMNAMTRRWEYQCQEQERKAEERHGEVMKAVLNG